MNQVSPRLQRELCTTGRALIATIIVGLAIVQQVAGDTNDAGIPLETLKLEMEMEL